MKIWPFNLLDFLEVETQAKEDDLLAGVVLAMSNLEKQDERILLQTVDKVLRETSVSRSIFLCVYEIYSENRKFSLGLCHP